MKKLLALCVIALLIAGGYVYVATRDLPSIEKVLAEGVQPSRFTQVFAQDGSVILSYGKFRHQSVTLDEVSPHFVDALLATEDRRFYSHFGVDVIALARAVLRDIRHGKLLEGGSTITQQLARNVFLSNERSLKRKVREAVLAVKLEQKLSKRRILEMYINNTYFGEGAYGIAAASEIYFNKKPAQLTVDEAAMLAGLPQAPSFLSPFNNPEAAKKRRNEVLGNLVETGKLDPEQIKPFEEKGFNLNAAGRELASGDRAPFFNRFVISQVQKQFDLDEQTFWHSGLKIYTTLDVSAQSHASQAVRSQTALFGRKGQNQQAALVSLDPKTGGVRAYVGGKDFSISQFDRVSQALRSPGSLFKVFTYTTAIDRGFEPTRVYLDEPVTFGNWSPHNYDNSHHGYMTLARALATSNNVVAVKLLDEVGPSVVIQTAQRMGLHANLENNLSLTLGSSGVTLLDITAAFSVLAGQGNRVEPYAIEKIVDSDGDVRYKHKHLSHPVLSRTTVDTMVSILQGAVLYGTGRGADIGRPMAGKTGTSDDHRDAWFIGFTPDIITGVWVGNDDNSPMPGITGGSLPAAIWKAAMRPYFSKRLATDFDLTYSRPLVASDFTTYNIQNLADSETFDPNALEQEESATELQEGYLESDPLLQDESEHDLMAPVPGSPFGGGVPPATQGDPALETEPKRPSDFSPLGPGGTPQPGRKPVEDVSVIPIPATRNSSRNQPDLIPLPVPTSPPGGAASNTR